MAGHSKWANIKHRKARADAKKGKAFSKVTKEIISAVRLGGPDPKSNTRLRLALLKAKSINLPQENIERNIKKASQKDSAEYHQVTYELYGAGGVGIICTGMTDNKNRCASDLRIVQNKTSATMADPGSVLFNFDLCGVITLTPCEDPQKLQELLERCIDLGALDFEEGASKEFPYRLLTDPKDLHRIYEELQKEDAEVESFEIEYLPKAKISCIEEHRNQNEEILSRLEELEDLDDLYHNMEDQQLDEEA